jgi:hypothetical protein
MPSRSDVPFEFSPSHCQRHLFLPNYSHPFCPTTAIFSPRWWHFFLPITWVLLGVGAGA